MKIALLTSADRGFASICLPYLAESPACQVSLIITDRQSVSRSEWKRRLKKTLRIGVLGALNGIRMRRWYREDVAETLDIRSLKEEASALGIPVREVDLHAPSTVSLLDEYGIELVLSAGNRYIPSRIFGRPKFGGINVHHEVLPEFRGAQSVLWQLYYGSTTTGFTIHKIEKKIDAGAILLCRRMPITFRPTIGQTVTATYCDLLVSSAQALPLVIADLSEGGDRVAESGRSEWRQFTTPSLWAFLRMLMNHRRLRRSVVGEHGPGGCSA